MAKKTKEPRTKMKNSSSASDSGSSDIFKKLFGGIPQEGDSLSLFSDSNPFRRKPSDQIQKPQQSKSGFGSVEPIENPNNGNSDANVDVELKERNMKKDKRQSFDSVSVEEVLETKKMKMKNPEEEGEDLNADITRRGKKKRKRDEVEREYEVKRYGVETQLEDGKGGVEGKPVVGGKRKMVDNPSEMMVSKEGFDDESKLLRTVFVGNLPLKVKKKALLKEFSQFGEIDSVRIRSVPILDTKTPRKGAIMKKQINDSVDNVHAYVVFKTEQSAQASLAHNMAVFDGNHIRVDRACPPRKKLKEDSTPLYDNKRTVFVGNLPFDVKDEELYQLFCGMNQLESSVEAVRVIRHSHTSVGKGIAYILFKTRDAANLVVKKRNLKLRDRDLRLSHANSDSTPLKRKDSPAAGTGNPPAKKFAGDSRIPSRSDSLVNTKSASYQGLRASKSGVEKKVRSKPIEPTTPKSTQKGEKLKVRNLKRPAVAARKAALKRGSASKQSGKKRKFESRTPESQKKKAKKV